ncbi:hypothetical protein FEP47_02359 [Burkholderia multivorans]|nr:hypothetical protein [Burkholderia multivorans]
MRPDGVSTAQASRASCASSTMRIFCRFVCAANARSSASRISSLRPGATRTVTNASSRTSGAMRASAASYSFCVLISPTIARTAFTTISAIASFIDSIVRAAASACA